MAVDLCLLVASLVGLQTPSQPTENLTSFDSATVELRWFDGASQLWAGNRLLKDFGRNDGDARQALKIIRQLRVNQLGTIGKPRPVLEYWLSDGKAPQGPVAALHLLTFDNASLHILQSNGQWCVSDDRHVMFSFGLHPEDAQQALALFKKHGFNQIGTIGRPTPVMTFFVTTPQAVPGTLTKATAENPFMARPPASRVRPQNSGTTWGSSPPTGLVQATQQLVVPAGGIGNSGLGERLPFEWRQVRVKREGQDWKLVAGGFVLANFGANESAAHLAQRVVQHYRFTEFCILGQPGSTFRYFLVGGQAPRGSYFGVQSISFKPDLVHLQSFEASHVLTDGATPILNLGERAEEANEALKIIRQYRFDTLCKIGADDSGLSYFIRTR